jgi:hypothetical protein
MNADETKQFWRKSFTITGRLYYPNLLKPTTNKNGRATFNTMFAWKVEDNQKVMHDLNNFLMAAKTTFHPSVPMQFFVNPLKKYETYVRQDGKPNPEYLKGHMWVNAQTGVEMPPAIVDQTRQPVISEAEVYSGRNAVINISFFNIDKEKKGIGCNVNAVMLMPGGEREGGAGSVNVDQIFGAFAKETNLSTSSGESTPPAWPPTGSNNNSNGFV